MAEPESSASAPTKDTSVDGSGPTLVRWWKIVVVVGIVAVLVRVLFVIHVSAQADEVGAYDNAGDAKQYIALARNLAEFRRFIDDSRPFGTTYYSLLRPPLYPALAAPFLAHEWRAAFFILQAFIGALIPMFAVLLVAIWFESRAGAWLAGLMAALSPTGIGLCGQVMADGLFATLFAASIVAVALAARSPRPPRWLWTAGLCCGLATLVKPAGLYWAFVLPALVWLVFRASGTSVRWRHVAIAVAIGLALPAMWAARNYHVARVFAVSTVDAQNLRYYLAPQAEEWAKAGEAPGKGRLRRNRDRWMARDREDFGRISPAQIVRRQWAESFEIFRAYPNETLRAYTHNLGNHFVTPFNGFDYQFPKGGTTREIMGELEAITGSATAYAVFTTLCVASLSPLFLSKLRRDSVWRSRLPLVAAMVLTFVYVSGLSGTTYGTGSRILFPAHIAVQVLMGAGVGATSTLLRLRSTLRRA